LTNGTNFGPPKLYFFMQICHFSVIRCMNHFQISYTKAALFYANMSFLDFHTKYQPLPECHFGPPNLQICKSAISSSAYVRTCTFLRKYVIFSVIDGIVIFKFPIAAGSVILDHQVCTFLHKHVKLYYQSF
jgi:hypothetical protein